MESSTKHSLIDLKTDEHCDKPKRVRRKLFVTERKDKVFINKGYIDHRDLIEKLVSIVIK